MNRKQMFDLARLAEREAKDAHKRLQDTTAILTQLRQSLAVRSDGTTYDGLTQGIRESLERIANFGRTGQGVQDYSIVPCDAIRYAFGEVLSAANVALTKLEIFEASIDSQAADN